MEENKTNDWLMNPLIANILAVASGLSFFFLCMILPLVGPAGSKVTHAVKNKMAFIGVLLLTLVLAGSAACLKMKRRSVDGSPLPYWSLGLCVVCILTFIVLMAGGFAI